MKIWKPEIKNTTGMVVLLMLVFAFAAATPGASAGTIGYSFDADTILSSEYGEEIINNHAANITLTALRNNSKTWNTTSFTDPTNTSINVSIKFLDALGLHVDVTGDGTADTFYGTENTAIPGRYNISINTSSRPGEYRMYMYANATNSSSNTLIEEGIFEVSVYIADKHWITTWMDEGDAVTIDALKFELSTVNDRGAVAMLGTSLVTMSPDTNTGEIFRQVDLDGDGLSTDWVFVKEAATSDERTTVSFWSENYTFPEIGTLESVKVSGDTVTRKAWLKDNSNYRQIILWDQSPMASLKADDYYIIPQKGKWTEGYGQWHGMTTIVKRTTWLGLLSSEEEVFNGDVFGASSVGDDTLDLVGSYLGNSANLGATWLIQQGFGTMTYPSNYEMKFREAAVPVDLEMRGSMVYSGLGTSEWNALVIQDT